MGDKVHNREVVKKLVPLTGENPLEKERKHIYFDERRKIEGLIELTKDGIFYIELVWWRENYGNSNLKKYGFLTKDIPEVVWFYLKNELAKNDIPVYKKYFIQTSTWGMRSKHFVATSVESVIARLEGEK